MKGIKNEIRQRWYLRWILLPSNWLAQGIINADKTEKTYKITFTLLFWGLFFIWFNSYNMALAGALILSFIIAHTLNWFVNGAISSILAHRLFIGKLSKEKAFRYLYTLEERLQKEGSIKATAVFGSITRGELKPSSDIDITFVRKPGFLNALKAILFMVKEKFAANLGQIPIEPFLVDSISYMKKRYRSDEIPIIIKGNKEELNSFYNKTSSIKEAAEKNGI